MRWCLAGPMLKPPSKPMRIICPRCGRPVPGEDIHLARGAALCRPCGEIMDLPALVAKEAPTLYRPDSLRWHEVDGDTSYTAVSSPSRWAAIPLLGFAA